MDGAGSKTQWQSLVNRLKKEGLLPCVVFNFSKKKCEECADYLGGEDLNAARERSQVWREGGREGGREGESMKLLLLALNHTYRCTFSPPVPSSVCRRRTRSYRRYVISLLIGCLSPPLHPLTLPPSFPSSFVGHPRPGSVQARYWRASRRAPAFAQGMKR